jgi:cyclase
MSFTLIRPLRLVFAVALFIASAYDARAVTGAAPVFQKLADDVYAYVGKLNDANAMIIVTTQGVVVVNTGNSQPDSRNIAKFVRSVTSQPIRYVVITQNHGDHIGGAPLFSPPATLIVHDKVAHALATMQPYQIKTWRARFPERAEAMQNFNPIDTVASFSDRMTLHLGGKTIDLIYVDDQYNIGDVLVWLPESGVLHDAFGGYIGRHPDLRPDYGHGTSWGMLKEVEAGLTLKPKIFVPNHGPIGETKDLEAMVDYLVLARQKVRAMIDKGMSLPDITHNFNMDEYKGWDRTSHLPWIAETIWRELQGVGPLVPHIVEKEVKGTITQLAEEGRFLTVSADDGSEIRLRIGADSYIGGIPDRSFFKTGMTFTASYQIPEGANAALGYDIMEIDVTP